MMSPECLAEYGGFWGAYFNSYMMGTEQLHIDLCDPASALNMSATSSSVVCNSTDLYWDDDSQGYMPWVMFMGFLETLCHPCNYANIMWQLSLGMDGQMDITKFCDPTNAVNTTSQAVIDSCSPDEIPDENGVGIATNLQAAEAQCNPCLLAFYEMYEMCDSEEGYDFQIPLTLNMCGSGAASQCYSSILNAEMVCATDNIITDDGLDYYQNILDVKGMADMVIANEGVYCNDCNEAWLGAAMKPNGGCWHENADCSSCIYAVQDVLEHCASTMPPQTFVNTWGTDMDFYEDMADMQMWGNQCEGGGGQCVMISSAAAMSLNASPCM